MLTRHLFTGEFVWFCVYPRHIPNEPKGIASGQKMASLQDAPLSVLGYPWCSSCLSQPPARRCNRSAISLRLSSQQTPRLGGPPRNSRAHGQHLAPSTSHLAPSTKHQAPSTKHQAPSTKHPAPSTSLFLCSPPTKYRLASNLVLSPSPSPKISSYTI
jgi:hypothetical protein